MKKLLPILAIITLLTACSSDHRSMVMVTSVSSDGHYAVTSSTRKKLILWDLQNKASRMITNDANAYSAYFIKGTNDFMYQDNETNEVIIEDVKDHTLKQFDPGFAANGEVISPDLSHYFGVDQNDQLFMVNNGVSKQLTFYHCNASDAAVPQGMQGVCGSIINDKNASTLALNNDASVLYSAIAGSVYIWNAKTGTLIRHISSDTSLDNIALSSDNRYLLASSLHSNQGMLCNLQTNTCQKITYAIPSNVEPLTSLFKKGYKLVGDGASIAVAFIAPNYFVNFINTTPSPFNYGILYDLQTLKPTKILPVEHDSSPISITDNGGTGRNLSMDTIPALGLVVSGAFKGEGIIVYRFNPQTQTLTTDWVGTMGKH